MEIERQCSYVLQQIQNLETKKVSWKWRLKENNNMADDVIKEETKKVSWKWRLKAAPGAFRPARESEMKQRKSPENGDWKMMLRKPLMQ